MRTNIYKEVSKELGVDEEVVKHVFNITWDFIKERISKLDLKRDLTEDEFNNMKAAFVLPNLGMLGCNYDFYKRAREKFLLEESRYDKIKKRKTIGESCNHDNGSI